jgi:hypothetical protein
MTIEWCEFIEPVATDLLGEPNAEMSRPPEDVRFGNKGSVSVNYETGIWFDHENNRGGGVMDLIRVYAEIEDTDEAAQFAENCRKQFETTEKPKPKPKANGRGNTPQNNLELEETYTYLDAAGKLALEVKRFAYRQPDGGYITNTDGKRLKTFRQSRPDGAPVVPYRLPQLLEAIAAGETILMPEGERKVDTLRAMGFAATCAAEGAKKWKPEHTAFLKGADVVLLPDNDPAGREHVDAIATSLAPVARRLRILELPGLPEKGDIVDWVAAGGTAEEFKRLVDAAPEYKRDENEGPQPLSRPLPPPEPFPAEALDDLAPAAEAICDHVQSPFSMCASATLAATSFAVSWHLDIILPTGQPRPASCWFWCIAESGERKTATDEKAFRPQSDYEKNLRARYEVELSDYNVQNSMWAAQAKAIEKQFKDLGSAGSEAHSKALEKLGPAPKKPLGALIMSSDFTFEGLVRSLTLGQAVYGIIGSEGGQFIGGHGMNEEAKLRTITNLSAAWDGQPIKRVRADEITILFGRRVGMHLMIQPEVAALALCDELLLKQGFLSRILVCSPESLIGKRKHKSPSPEAEKALGEYNRRLLEIIETPLPLAPDTQNELRPRAVPFSAEATKLFWEFADEVDAAMGPGGEYETIRPFAAKLPEHAARLGITLAGYKTNLKVEQLSAEHFAYGIRLAVWYATEAVRLSSITTPTAQKLLDWLLLQPDPTITARKICRYGPNSIRDRDTALELCKVLESHGWLIPIKARRRDTREWTIVRE